MLICIKIIFRHFEAIPRQMFYFYLQLITVESKSRKEWVLTEEGEHVLANGSHEAAVYNAIPEGSEVRQADIISKSPFARVGLSKALAASWVELVKKDNETFVRRKVLSITDETQQRLKELQTLSDDSKKEYKKRKLIKEKWVYYECHVFIFYHYSID